MKNMKEYVKKAAVGSLFVGLLVLAFFAGMFVVLSAPRHGVSHVSANVYITENTGGVSSTLAVGNVITDIAENYIRDILGFDNVTDHNATQWVSLSNDGSPVQTWTQLPNEVDANGCSRVLGNLTAWYEGGDYGFNVTAKFDVSGTQQLQCAGLQWSGVASSDENLFACAVFTQTTFESGDSLTITWVITVDAN